MQQHSLQVTAPQQFSLKPQYSPKRGALQALVCSHCWSSLLAGVWLFSQAYSHLQHSTGEPLQSILDILQCSTALSQMCHLLLLTCPNSQFLPVTVSASSPHQASEAAVWRHPAAMVSIQHTKHIALTLCSICLTHLACITASSCASCHFDLTPECTAPLHCNDTMFMLPACLHGMPT